mmetsp:Transcript_116851/g.330602  ORF Transcript_116851/g.330602 Transcript_116851/m.330602 type:complete len:205 (+) Transcript_116851:501-1115(+)
MLGLFLSEAARTTALEAPIAAQDHLPQHSRLGQVIPRHVTMRDLLANRNRTQCVYFALEPKAYGSVRQASVRHPGRVLEHGRHVLARRGHRVGLVGQQSAPSLLHRAASCWQPDRCPEFFPSGAESESPLRSLAWHSVETQNPCACLHWELVKAVHNVLRRDRCIRLLRGLVAHLPYRLFGVDHVSFRKVPFAQEDFPFLRRLA